MYKIVFLILVATVMSCKPSSNESARQFAEIYSPKNNSLQEAKNIEKTNISTEYFYKHLIGKVNSDTLNFDVFISKKEISLVYYKNNSKGILLFGKIDKNNKFIASEIAKSGSKPLRVSGEIIDNNNFFVNLNYPEENKANKIALKADYLQSAAIDVYSFENKFSVGSADFEDKLVYYKLKGSYNEINNFLLEQYFGGKNDNKDIKEMLSEYSTKFSNDFKTENYGISWNRAKAFDITFNERNFLSCSIYYSEYSGGVHGNSGINFFVFDLKKDKRILPDDVFLPSYKTKLQQMIYEKIKKYHEFSDAEMDEQYDLSIQLTDNFYIYPGGMSFYYNTYDITAYVNGPENVEFNIDEIKNLLKPEYLKSIYGI